MFGVVHFELLTQRLIRGADSRRLVDADLIGDRQVQREVEKGIHLPALGRELLRHRRLRVLKQRVVFGMLFDEVGGGHFGAFEDKPRAVLAPGVAEEKADLFT